MAALAAHLGKEVHLSELGAIMAEMTGHPADTSPKVRPRGTKEMRHPCPIYLHAISLGAKATPADANPTVAIPQTQPPPFAHNVHSAAPSTVMRRTPIMTL